jgi:hypothetical protein
MSELIRASPSSSPPQHSLVVRSRFPDLPNHGPLTHYDGCCRGSFLSLRLQFPLVNIVFSTRDATGIGAIPHTQEFTCIPNP